MSRALVLLALATSLLLACGEGRRAPAAASHARSEAAQEAALHDPSRFFVDPDLFLAADDPATVPAGKASFLHDDDEVFGIVVRGHARAYPITMLSYHHVVNDVIEGIPVAVTY
jgi:hypothetical protein